MKNSLLKTSIILFFLAPLLFSQSNSPSISLSGYYTGGNYSNQNTSKGFSLYSSVGFSGGDYLIVGFDQLKISNDEWSYDQKMFTGGIIKNLFPFYIKVNYAHVNGTFDYKPFTYTYDDILNIYNVNMLYNYNLFYFGAGFTYQDLNGFISIVSKQFKLNVSWLISSKFSFSAYSIYSTITDGRKLSSVYGEVTYNPAKIIKITIGGMAGLRAYYFDEHLLTIFNQDETQKKHYKAKLEFSVSNRIKLPLVFQYADFETYNIKYYTAGLVLKL